MPDAGDARERLAILIAELKRLDASLESHRENLESICRTFPDTPDGQGLAGAWGANNAKARLRSQIERCSRDRADLMGRITQAEMLLPVDVKPMKALRLRDKPKGSTG